MDGLMLALVILLVICAVAVSATKKMLPSIIIFMSYSLIMSIIWLILEAPDLAITEAAVGAGITSVLFFITLKRLGILKKELKEDEEEAELHIAKEENHEE